MQKEIAIYECETCGHRFKEQDLIISKNFYGYGAFCPKCKNYTEGNIIDFIYTNNDDDTNKIKKGRKIEYWRMGERTEKYTWICCECGLEWFSKEQARYCRKRGHVKSYYDGRYTQKAIGQY